MRVREVVAREILERRRKGETYQGIAAAVGVSIGTVANICRGRTWAHLTQIQPI